MNEILIFFKSKTLIYVVIGEAIKVSWTNYNDNTSTRYRYLFKLYQADNNVLYIQKSFLIY